MLEDILKFFIKCAEELGKGDLSLANADLEEIVLKSTSEDLAYIDNREYAKKEGYDFLESFNNIPRGIKDKQYTESNLFPDFLFRVKEENGSFKCGSVLELKDAKGKRNIASFNSTIPTKYKTLEEIDTINGGNLVSRIAKIIDSPSNFDEYYSFDRHSIYLVRSGKGKEDVVKLSLIDGSFFETVPKEHLFYQMFLQVLHAHIEKKEIEIPPENLKIIEEGFKYITDQRIIAGSKIIEKASIKPRLRIMAEVQSEGNPHSTHYEIPEKSFNLILNTSLVTEELKEEIRKKLPKVQIFSIYHKRNGEHIVFSLPFNAVQQRLPL